MAVDTTLKPLAMLEGGITLCTTPGQDQYFLVQTSGRRDKIDVHAACKHYRAATKVVWGTRARVPTKKKASQQPVRSTTKWKKKMEEALQRDTSTDSSK